MYARYATGYMTRPLATLKEESLPEQNLKTFPMTGCALSAESARICLSR